MEMELEEMDVVQDQKTTSHDHHVSVQKTNPNSSSTSRPARGGLDYSRMQSDIINCNLFPPEFANHCSRDCPAQVTELLEFQEWFKQIKKHYRQLQRYLFFFEDHVDDLVIAINWKWNVQTDLYDMLTALRKSKGQEPDPHWKAMRSASHEKKETYSKITALVDSVGMWPDYGNKVQQQQDDLDPSLMEYPPHPIPVAILIRYGRSLYKKIKCKELVYELLDNIEEIEREHDLEREKHSGADVSEQCILKQIEVVNKIPVGEVVNEIEEHLVGWRDFDKCKDMVDEAVEVIEDTARDLITMRMRTGLRKEGHKGEKCSLVDILESFLEKVDLFKKRWKFYANFFNAYDDQPIFKNLPTG